MSDWEIMSVHGPVYPWTDMDRLCGRTRAPKPARNALVGMSDAAFGAAEDLRHHPRMSRRMGLLVMSHNDPYWTVVGLIFLSRGMR